MGQFFGRLTGEHLQFRVAVIEQFDSDIKRLSSVYPLVHIIYKNININI